MRGKLKRDRLGVSQAQVARIEKRGYDADTLNTLRRYLRALGCGFELKVSMLDTKARRLYANIALRPVRRAGNSCQRDVRRLKGGGVADFVRTLKDRLDEQPLSEELVAASKLITGLVEEAAYVGGVYSLGYDEGLVQIHDYHRQQVGGIPALSLLIATRIMPSKDVDVTLEDASIILLRVLDSANLPNSESL